MKRYILVVDDDSATRELLIEMLTGHGYEVRTARNGIDGLKMFNIGKYDLIISDIDMPLMNGIEFYKELIKNAPFMRDRIIFITDNIEYETKRFIKEEGVKYISKPLTIVEFINTVNDIIGIAPSA